MENITRESVAFEQTVSGYLFRATYLIEPKGDALIEIEKDGQLVKEFLWPSYKIWNIAAHAHDIAGDLDQQSDEAIYDAGSTGFGGNVYQPDSQP